MTFICTICSDSLVESKDQRPCAIPCGHAFHKDCLTAWINLAFKCPICNRKTKHNDIIFPLFFSSDNDITGNEAPELYALLQATRLQHKDMTESLKESRMANKYLQEELKRSSDRAAKNYKKRADTLTKDLDVAKNQLKAKQSELGKMGNELGKVRADLIRAKEEILTKDAEISCLKEEARISRLKPKHPFPFTFNPPPVTTTPQQPQELEAAVHNSIPNVSQHGKIKMPTRRLSKQAVIPTSVVPTFGKPSMQAPAAFVSTDQQAAAATPKSRKPYPARENVSFGFNTTNQRPFKARTGGFSFGYSNQEEMDVSVPTSSNAKRYFATKAATSHAAATPFVFGAQQPFVAATQFVFGAQQPLAAATPFGANQATPLVFGRESAPIPRQGFASFTQLADRLTEERSARVNNWAPPTRPSHTEATTISPSPVSFSALSANAQFTFNL